MKQKIYDKIATSLLWASGFIILFILVWFLYRIFSQGLPALSLHFISSKPLEMDKGGGIGPEIFNTFYVLLIALIVSIPIGVGAGIYLAEFAEDNIVTRIIRVSVECLASVPSIVFGLFGMILFVEKMGWGFSMMGGALTLALLNLPVIVRATEESIRTVSINQREASLALGATKWQTIKKIVLPSAAPGILTGINLAVGRAIGESAVLIYTAGTSISRHFAEFNPFTSGETLSVHLWYVKSVGLIPDANQVAAGTSAVLILIILIINLIMKFISYRIRVKHQGA